MRNKQDKSYNGPSFRVVQGSGTGRGHQAEPVISMGYRAGSSCLGKPRQLELQGGALHIKGTAERLYLGKCQSTRLRGNYWRPGKESSGGIKWNSAWHSPRAGNSTFSCSLQPDWKNSSLMGSVFGKVLPQQWK